MRPLTGQRADAAMVTGQARRRGAAYGYPGGLPRRAGGLAPPWSAPCDDLGEVPRQAEDERPAVDVGGAAGEGGHGTTPASVPWSRITSASKVRIFRWSAAHTGRS